MCRCRKVGLAAKRRPSIATFERAATRDSQTDARRRCCMLHGSAGSTFASASDLRVISLARTRSSLPSSSVRARSVLQSSGAAPSAVQCVLETATLVASMRGTRRRRHSIAPCCPDTDESCQLCLAGERRFGGRRRSPTTVRWPLQGWQPRPKSQAAAAAISLRPVAATSNLQ